MAVTLDNVVPWGRSLDEYVSMFDLTEKNALVTGASGGIGGAIAKALAAQGARVALSGTRVEALEEVAAGIDGAVVVPGNLSDPEAVAGLLARAEEALGPIDILVNNAGLTRDMLAMRMKEEDWDLVLQVNLSAGFHLAKACLRGMMKRRWGRIIGPAQRFGIWTVEQLLQGAPALATAS